LKFPVYKSPTFGGTQILQLWESHWEQKNSSLGVSVTASADPNVRKWPSADVELLVFLLGAPADRLTDTQCDSKLLSGFPWPIIFKPGKKERRARWSYLQSCSIILIIKGYELYFHFP
jgi:hypothetical protein